MNIYDIIGIFAIIFSLIGFVIQDKRKMLGYGIIATLLFGISIYGYGGYNGLVVSVISIIVKILSLILDKKYLKYIGYSAPFIALLAFMVLPEGLKGLIPALSLFFIIGADTQEDILKMKIWYYGSNLLWLSYGILCMSYTAIMFDVLGFIALTYSIYSIYISRKNKNNLKK